MELNDFIKLLKRSKKFVLLSVVTYLIIASVYTFVQPLEYSATSRLLIVQNNTSGLDPFVASKANEYLSNILTNVIESNSFFEETMNSGFNINKSYFSGDVSSQMKKWQKTVSAKTFSDSGLIEIKVFHRDKYQADQIAQAVDFVLKTKNDLYHSPSDQITIKVVDQPIISDWPVRPNIILNLSLGLAMGFIYSFFYIYLFGASDKAESKKSAKVKNHAAVLPDAGNSYAEPVMAAQPLPVELQPEKPIEFPAEDFTAQGSIDNIFKY